MTMGAERREVKRMRSYLGAASLLAFVSFAPVAVGQEPTGTAESNVAETGKRLSNPVSDVLGLVHAFRPQLRGRRCKLGPSEGRGQYDLSACSAGAPLPVSYTHLRAHE